ncbi:MAG: ABC transporter substrate-binding protein [Solirubrobacteraceae bacterium]|jgi:sulfonate transport system substrate-binding protein
MSTRQPHEGRARRRGRRSGASRWVGPAATLLVCAIATACGSSSTTNTSNATSAAGSVATSTATSNAAATATSNAAALSQVTLRVGDQAGTGAQALLSAAGLLAKLPFKITWSDFTSGPPILQAINAGALDIGGVGDAPPVFAAAGGAKIAIVGAFATNPDNAGLVLPKDSPITSIGQLRGKKIAVAQGSSADYHLLTVLSKAGLSVHDVSLVYVQPAEGLAALSAGSVAAWDIWAPFIQQVQAQRGATVLVNGDGYGSNYSYVVASRAALDDSAKAAAISDYLKLLDQAHIWANTHPQAWAVQWAKATGLPLGVMVAAAKDDTATPVPINGQIVAAEQSLVDAFSTAGLIPKKYNFASYSYSGFNSVIGSGA